MTTLQRAKSEAADESYQVRIGEKLQWFVRIDYLEEDKESLDKYDEKFDQVWSS